MNCLVWRILNKLYKLVWITILITPFILVPLAIYDNSYPLSRDVQSHLDYAMTLTNATDIRQELMIAYKNLEPYHGNPCWLFPTPRTDFDYIKQKLKELINTTEQIEKMNLTQYAYHQYIRNLKDSIQKINDMLGDASFWRTFNPTSAILIVIYFTIIIILLMMDWDIRHKIDDKLWECRYK